MNEKEKYLESLSEIRSLMEKSTVFISLSGLSGIFAGLCGVAAGIFAYWYFGCTFNYVKYFEQTVLNSSDNSAFKNFFSFVLYTGISTLFIAVGVATLFTARKAKRQNQKLINSITVRLMINMLIPLVAGGIFCIALLVHHNVDMIPSVTLLFYGIALVNASKYTLHNIRTLGLFEVALGCISSFFYEYSLLFWIVGFGILHLIYGTVMYLKYDYNKG